MATAAREFDNSENHQQPDPAADTLRYVRQKLERVESAFKGLVTAESYPCSEARRAQIIEIEQKNLVHAIGNLDTAIDEFKESLHARGLLS